MRFLSTIVVVFLGLNATSLCHASKQPITTASIEIRLIENAATLYYLDHSLWPESIDELISKNYLERMPKDPWGRAYNCSNEPPSIAEAEMGVYIWTYGKDNEPGGSKLNQDLGNWQNPLPHERRWWEFWK